MPVLQNIIATSVVQVSSVKDLPKYSLWPLWDKALPLFKKKKKKAGSKTALPFHGSAYLCELDKHQACMSIICVSEYVVSWRKGHKRLDRQITYNPSIIRHAL